jgi:hypothetical protein
MDGLDAGEGPRRISQQGSRPGCWRPLSGSRGMVSRRAGQPPAGGQGARLGRTSRVVGLAVVPVRLVVNSAGLAGGEAVVHIQRSSYGLSVNDRSDDAAKGLL